MVVGRGVLRSRSRMEDRAGRVKVREKTRRQREEEEDGRSLF